jgi:two-component system chemotaxis sensor kinase CheA
MDMSKYVKMYVSESQERLQRMDALLLALEQNGADRSSIDTLFREAHSIKGMSASMGYEELAKLSHRLEDYLEQFRGGKSALDRTGVDLLFEGVDLLRRAVEEVAAGQPPSLVAAPFLAKMAVHLLTGAPPPVAPPPQAPEQPSSSSLARYTLQVQIAADAPLPSARAYITLRRIKDLGEVIRSAPSGDQVQAGKFAGTLSILLATSRSAAEVQAVVSSLPDVAAVAVHPAAAESEAAAPRPPAPAAARASAPPLAPSMELPPAGPAAPPPLQELVGAPVGTLRRGSAMIRVDTRLLDDLMDLVGELVTVNSGLTEQCQQIDCPTLHERAGRVDSLVKSLQQQTMKLRMMPLEMIADRFPRAVRDLARKRGKELHFEVLGKEIELDRAILEELPDPILHILRNAVDHGIEPPEERVRKGKPPQGSVRLEASKERETVVIRVRDDGRGMDPAVLRRTALERGVITREQYDSLPDGESLSLITLPGFSTAQEVSDVSGRGVGMDVVKNAVESLHGGLLIESVVGRGSTITLRLPLTLAVVAVLLVELGGERYALPVTSVEQILEVPATEIQRSQGQEMIASDGALIPLMYLRRALGSPEAAVGPTRLVVLCAIRGRLVGVVVERFIGYREVVVKSLGKALKGLRGFAGVTILGDGSTVLILDLNTL